MSKPNHKHSYSYSSDEEDNVSDSGEKIQHESQFHTFAGSKGNQAHKRMVQASSQEEQDSEQDLIGEKSPEKHQSESENSSDDNEKIQEESFDMIEARIKKLENQLSRKLKKISPEREIDKHNIDPAKKLLKPKFSQLDKVVLAKQGPKKQSMSPRHKKAKSKQIKNSSTSSSNPFIPSSKHITKRANESYQLRTIEEGKPNKPSTRKLTQSQQGKFKQPSQKQTIEDQRKQNDQLKAKVQSKSKKRSCVQKQIQDMDYLKSKISSTGMTKLEKEIELLKIVESIRVKLKRSINHKLNKMYPDSDKNSKQSKVSTFLLHRGCPANYLN